MNEQVTKRIGSIIRLKPEYRERYIVLHRHTFPEVLARIRKSNIRNYSIFLADDILFSYFEYIGGDYDRDMAAIADPVTKEWWTLTDPMQDPFPGRKNGEWWAAMDGIAHFEGAREVAVPQKRYAFMLASARFKNRTVGHFPAGESSMEIFQNAGMRNGSFYFNNRWLFVYFEHAGIDPSRDVQIIHDTFREWNACTGTFEPANDEWQAMTEIFHTL